MTVEIRFTLLGTGSSGGVPRVGGDWGVCDPNEPRNRRTRCCALLEKSQGEHERATRILIDTSPDLRTQLLSAGVDALDGVLFTHDHADQTHGIDDLRPLVYRMRKQLPVYLDDETACTLVPKFRYVFEGSGGYPAILDRQAPLKPGEALRLNGPGGPVEVLPLRMVHGAIVSLGFRIGALAYCNDVNELPEETLSALKGVDTFIVDALRITPHPSHANLDQALAWAEAIGARRTILTNLHVDMDYASLVEMLPAGVEPGYDGCVITVADSDK